MGAFLCDRIGAPAVPARFRAIEEGEEQVVIQGTSALWWIGKRAEKALPTLLEIAGSGQRTDAARLAAIRAALKIGPAVAVRAVVHESVCVLMRLLERGSIRQQEQAAEALGAIGPSAQAALPLLRQRAMPPLADANVERRAELYRPRSVPATPAGSAGGVGCAFGFPGTDVQSRPPAPAVCRRT